MKWFALITALFFFSAQAAEKTLTCPHYSLSPVWDTQIALYNPQRNDVPITVTAYTADGAPAVSGELMVPAEGGLDSSLKALFPEAGTQSGWLEIKDPSGSLEGNLNYVFALTGATGTVPLQEQRGRHLVLPLLENDGLWQSGLAVTNPNAADATIKMTLKFEDGRPVGVTEFALAPGQKQVGMLTESFDSLPARGQLVIEADQPLSVLAIGVGPAFLQLKAQNAEVLANTPERRITDYSEVQGAWERLGYGILMGIFDEQFVLFDTGDGTCADPVVQLPIDAVGLEFYLDDHELLRVEVPITAETYYFQRIDAVPGECEQDNDPVRNFEAFVNTFETNFAFFDALDYDWEAAVAEARTLVTANTSDQELFDILSALQDPTDDGHGNLESEFDESEPGEPGPYLQDLLAHFEDQDDIDEFDLFQSIQRNRFNEVLAQYVPNLKTTANNRFLWGEVDGDTAYLQITATYGFSNDPEDLFGEAPALEEALDQVFTDIAAYPVLILDNRWNPGGYDFLAQHIASRFADRERLAYSEKGRYRDSFTPWRSHWITPHPTRPAYEGRVVYLTSSNTGSAAEIMTLLLRTLPNLTHIGERTAGALSDSLGVSLPNGWQLSLSNEIYVDAAGEWYEFRGIPPEIAVPHFNRADREAGRDSILETAIQFTKQ